MPCFNTATCKRLQRVLRRQCSYTAHAVKQRTGFYRRFSCYLTHSTAADTRQTQAAIYHLRHAGAYHIACTAYTDTRYQRHAGRYTGQHSRPIIIRYIREQRCAPVADHAIPAGSAPSVCGSLASADTLSAVQARRTC